MKSKCLLDITGQADPTGSAREGFSYIKVSHFLNLKGRVINSVDLETIIFFEIYILDS